MDLPMPVRPAMTAGILRYSRDLAFAAATAWSGSYCVTAYVGNIHFHDPVQVGEMVELPGQGAGAAADPALRRLAGDAERQRAGSGPVGGCVEADPVAADQRGQCVDAAGPFDVEVVACHGQLPQRGGQAQVIEFVNEVHEAQGDVLIGHRHQIQHAHRTDARLTGMADPIGIDFGGTGIKGAPGKCPWKNSSLTATFLTATRRRPSRTVRRAGGARRPATPQCACGPTPARRWLIRSTCLGTKPARIGSAEAPYGSVPTAAGWSSISPSGASPVTPSPDCELMRQRTGAVPCGDPTGTGSGGSGKGNLMAEFNNKPFERGTAAREHGARGWGLGLFIAKKIVTAHGGEISAAEGDASGLWYQSDGSR